MPVKLWFAMALTIIILFGLLLGILAAIGYFFSLSGYLIVLLAFLIIGIQWYISPYIIKWTTNMQELKRSEEPWIFEFVEALCKQTKTPIPQVAIANTSSPNAFVFGRTSNSATLVITRGLLKSLNKEEVKAVIAHEIGHINHKDMIVMTLAGAVPVLAYFVARFLLFAPSKEDRKSASSAVLIGFFAFIVYIISNLIVLLLSRLREFYADRFSGQHTTPRLLANALAKITYGLSLSKENEANSAVRSFFIADPITSKREVSSLSREYEDLVLEESEIKKAMEWEEKNPLVRILELTSTHPLTFKRIKALLEMEKGFGV
jgi:heat shock protein HtpX